MRFNSPAYLYTVSTFFGILILLFGYFVWPSVYVYGKDKSQNPIRTHRVNGCVQYLDNGSWTGLEYEGPCVKYNTGLEDFRRQQEARGEKITFNLDELNNMYFFKKQNDEKALKMVDGTLQRQWTPDISTTYNTDDGKFIWTAFIDNNTYCIIDSVQISIYSKRLDITRKYNLNSVSSFQPKTSDSFTVDVIEDKDTATFSDKNWEWNFDKVQMVRPPDVEKCY